MSLEIGSAVRQHADDLLDFIDSSPSPWHAVASLEQRIQPHGFLQLFEHQSWNLAPGGRYYVIRGGSSIIFFVCGQKPLLESGFRIVGAHTDSPGFRIKPHPEIRTGKLVRLGVEIYGSPIVATFSDRDLSLAGRVSLRNPQSPLEINTQLVHFEKSLVRLPNLAIHMNRKVNEDGLRFDKQNEIPLIFAMTSGEQSFVELLGTTLDCDPKDILSWDLNVFDTQKGGLFGRQEEFFANSQLDNLASCHAAASAILSDNCQHPESTTVCTFFDHEEVGSESLIGADGCFLPDVLERIGMASGFTGEAYKQGLAKSLLISADMAHAFHPNFPSAYEPNHHVFVNSGPVIKINANQRYTSETESAAKFMRLCEQADAPWQKYTHRTNIPCGSTIGPMTSARLGIRSVDVGNPLWAMHSARESAGVLDHSWMTNVLSGFFDS